MAFDVERFNAVTIGFGFDRIGRTGHVPDAFAPGVLRIQWFGAVAPRWAGPNAFVTGIIQRNEEWVLVDTRSSAVGESRAKPSWTVATSRRSSKCLPQQVGISYQQRNRSGRIRKPGKSAAVTSSPTEPGVTTNWTRVLAAPGEAITNPRRIALVGAVDMVA